MLIGIGLLMVVLTFFFAGVTIVQISNGINWSGLNSSSIVDLMLRDVSKGAHYLSMVLMFMCVSLADVVRQALLLVALVLL